MPPIETLLAFAAATFVFAYMPGPALLYTAAQTLVRGRKAGLWAAFGIHIGCYAHILAASLGLSAIFSTVPALYSALKVVGGLYLIWLGIQMLRTGPNETQVQLDKPHKTQKRAFLDSILVEVLNPKVAVFFIAFLPQFVSQDAVLPIWAQFLILGTFVNVTFTSADLLVVLFASQAKERLARSSKWQTATRWIGGSLLMGLGFKLAAERT